MAASKFKKDRRDPGRFYMVPTAVHESQAYRSLGGSACKLLFDIASQYMGQNNGKLLAGWTFMSEERGWKGKHTLIAAKRELLAAGSLVVETRPGAFPSTSSWFACTWWPLDWCPEMEMAAQSFPRGAYRHEHLLQNAGLGAKSAQGATSTGAISALRPFGVGAKSALVAAE